MSFWREMKKLLLGDEQFQNLSPQPKPTLPKNFAKTRDEFVAKYGTIQKFTEMNEKWDECKVLTEADQKAEDGVIDMTNNAELFRGDFWTTGYHHKRDNPESIEDWQELDKALQIANQLAQILKNAEYVSCDVSQYYPFVLPKKLPFGFSEKEFRYALGFQGNAERWGGFENESLQMEEQYFQIPNAFHSDPYSDADKRAFQNAAQVMRENLTHLQSFQLPWDYFCHPILWIGQTEKGYLSGIWAVHLDT